jgi:hypothetical protein
MAEVYQSYAEDANSYLPNHHPSDSISDKSNILVNNHKNYYGEKGYSYIRDSLSEKIPYNGK